MRASIIVRVMGGLGNQLFCYAAGRSLALNHDAELVLDTVSNFSRDWQYHRSYALTHFRIAGREATRRERLEPLGRSRRTLSRWLSKRQRFERRTHVIEEHRGWDPRIRDLSLRGQITLDGYWQSFRYFDDIESTIRADLEPAPHEPTVDEPTDTVWRQLGLPQAPEGAEIVAVHVRWFDRVDPHSPENVALSYYERAIATCDQRLGSPYYLVFSDDIDATRRYLHFLPAGRTAFADGAAGDPSGVREFLLMSRCEHFIIANSTFSWWGAWLGRAPQKQVFAPDPAQLPADNFWRAPDLLPSSWTLL